MGDAVRASRQALQQARLGEGRHPVARSVRPLTRPRLLRCANAMRSLGLRPYRHGDTRERGLALAALAGAFREAGFGVAPGELPDYLPALLELAAAHPVGASVLGEHRAALEALRLALAEAASPYAGVVAAVSGVLPGPTRRDRPALHRYRAEGPPSEKVGLEPFAPPEVLGAGVTLGPARR